MEVVHLIQVVEVEVGEYMEVAHFQVVEAVAEEGVVEHLILEVEVEAEVLQPAHLSFPQSWAYCNKKQKFEFPTE